MVYAAHTCPYGLKAKHLLRRAGYEVADHHLVSREATDAFKASHSVATTPQVFIGGDMPLARRGFKFEGEPSAPPP